MVFQTEGEQQLLGSTTRTVKHKRIMLSLSEALLQYLDGPIVIGLFLVETKSLYYKTSFGHILSGPSIYFRGAKLVMFWMMQYPDRIYKEETFWFYYFSKHMDVFTLSFLLTGEHMQLASAARITAWSNEVHSHHHWVKENNCTGNHTSSLLPNITLTLNVEWIDIPSSFLANIWNKPLVYQSATI